MSVQSDSQEYKDELLDGSNESRNLIEIVVQLSGKQLTLLMTILEKIERIEGDINRFRPLVERYETAAKAGSFLKQRKILRQGLDSESGLPG